MNDKTLKHCSYTKEKLFKLFCVENGLIKNLFKYFVLQITVIPQKNTFPYYWKNQISFYEILFWCQRKSNSKLFCLCKLLCSAKADIWRCSVKKVFLKILQNSQEDNYARVFFNKVACLGLWISQNVYEHPFLWNTLGGCFWFSLVKYNVYKTFGWQRKGWC